MLKPATDFFPLAVPRSQQTRALQFLSNAYDKGYRDIVIAAPTGVGKTGIGAGACFWAAQDFGAAASKNGQQLASGGYYLVTQKLLQDQIERDFPIFKWPAGSIKSTVEYPCRGQYANCLLGQRRKPRCDCIRSGDCRQKLAKNQFLGSHMGVTNYPYYLTSLLYTKLKPRRMVVCDECHTLERQLMGFVEVTVDRETLAKFAPVVKPPTCTNIADFGKWLSGTYYPVLQAKFKSLEQAVDTDNPTEATEVAWARGENPSVTMVKRLCELQAHMTRVSLVSTELERDATNWVYWQEEDKEGHLTSICKPLYVDGFAREFFDQADVRLYLSAYPGPKKVFCRCLGLNPATTAWLDIPSSFPKDNRLIHLLSVGSMSRANEKDTLPSLLRMCERIMAKHGEDKGLIHCHKYELGETIYRHLCAKGYANRVLFPRRASERAGLLMEHHQTAVPTVLLSPSMAEGFSLDDDLARFQIIAKMPYPYLGDKQISARKNADADWYAMQTVMTVLQACGRIVRSETDFGATYILDADFLRLLNNHADFFPGWFTESFVDYKSP